MPTKRPAESQGRNACCEPAFCRSWLLLWTGGQTAPIELRQRKSGTTHRRWLPGLSLVSSSTTRLARKPPIPNGWQRRGLAGRISTMVRPPYTSRKAFPLPTTKQPGALKKPSSSLIKTHTSPGFSSFNCFDPHHPFDPPKRSIWIDTASIACPYPKYVPMNGMKTLYQQLDHRWAHNEPGGFDVQNTCVKRITAPSMRPIWPWYP